MFIPKNRILLDTIDPEKTDILGNNPPAIPPKEKTKKEPFNGIDLSPVMDEIKKGFSELNDKLKPKEEPPKNDPPKRNYHLGDELDPFLEA